jgi:alpha-amylase
MHKKMLALSALSRLRGDPPGARRAIGRAQCNDAYWHGLFGGLYLPFLRAEIWRNLAVAEEELRRGEGIEAETLDRDWDGNDEVWVHSSEFSALVSPARGGAVEELSRFALSENLADSLTRRREAYHIEAQALAAASAAAQHAAAGSAPSIHDIEASLRLSELPPIDLDDRAIFIERILPGSLDADSYMNGTYQPLASTATVRMAVAVVRGTDEVEVHLHTPTGLLSKRLTFFRDGGVRARFTWDASSFPADAWFTTEISLSRAHPLRTQPAAEVWEHPIETVAKSERGLDRTMQGVCYLLRWPVSSGSAQVDLPVHAD